jgi:ribonuclease HI
MVYPIIEKINHELKRFHTRPIFHWVKGHSGDTNNNIVHHLAQSACRDQEIPAKDITEFKSETGPVPPAKRR